MPRRKPTGKPTGRPKNRLSERTKALRKVADNALVSGKSPLDVMLRNMRQYFDEAEEAAKELQEQLRFIRDEEVEEDRNDAIAEAAKKFSRMHELRMSAQKCAVDCAPYVHARLSSIQFKGNVDHRVAAVVATMSPQEAADAYLSTIRSSPALIEGTIVDANLDQQDRPARLLDASADPAEAD